MKWAEGVCGAISGVGGVVVLALILWLGPIYARPAVCVGPVHPVCFTPTGAPGRMTTPTPDSALFEVAIPLGIVFAQFVGVLVGIWLDLRGRRLTGRIVLLLSTEGLLIASISILPAALFFVAPGALPAAGVGLAPFPALALVAFLLAGIRRDAPRPSVASSAQP